MDSKYSKKEWNEIKERIGKSRKKTYKIVNLALEAIDRGEMEKLKKIIEEYKGNQGFDINAPVVDEYKTRVKLHI